MAHSIPENFAMRNAPWLTSIRNCNSRGCFRTHPRRTAMSVYRVGAGALPRGRVIASRRSRYRFIDIHHRFGRLRFPLFAKSGKSYGPIIRIRARSHCLRPDVRSFQKAPVSMLNGIELKVAPVGLHCRTSDSEKSHQRLSQVTPATRRGRTSNSEKLHQ